MELLIIAPIIFLGIAFLIAFLGFPRQVLLGYILIKPVVDRFAEQGATGGEVTVGYNHVAPLIIPVMSLFYVILKRRNIFSMPLKIPIFLFILLNIVSFLFEETYSIILAGYYIRVVLPMVLYFTIPFILNKREDILRFIRFTAYSGLFPCLMIVLQQLGFIAQNRESEDLGGTVYARATGGYADAFSVALPIIISIFCILYLLQVNREQKPRGAILWVLLSTYLSCLVFTFHRMTFIVIGLVFTLWSVINRRIVLIVVLACLILASFPALTRFVPNFFSDIMIAEHVPGGSIGSPQQKIADQLMHGRGGVWQRYIKTFNESYLLQQTFGVYMAGRAPHNDYLRVLITNGVAGLAVYLTLLLAIGIKIFKTYLASPRANDPYLSGLSLTALFTFLFYVLGSVTLCISLLSTLTWYFWIFSGMTLYQKRNLRIVHRTI